MWQERAFNEYNIPQEWNGETYILKTIDIQIASTQNKSTPLVSIKAHVQKLIPS